MARRRLLDDAFWAGVFILPSDEREVVRHCTLTSDDLALVAAKRSPHGRLAYALLLLALRHPGRALEAGEVPPAPMVAYVARQVGADPAALAVHHLRPQTRREQLAELMRRGGFRSFGRAEARTMTAWHTRSRARAACRRTIRRLPSTPGRQPCHQDACSSGAVDQGILGIAPFRTDSNCAGRRLTGSLWCSRNKA